MRGRRGRRGRRGPWGRKARRDPLGLKDQRDPKAKPVWQERKVPLDPKETPDLQAHRALKVPPGRKVPQGKLACRDPRVTQERRV
jgi:hypothetical protein